MMTKADLINKIAKDLDKSIRILLDVYSESELLEKSKRMNAEIKKEIALRKSGGV